MSNEDTIFYLQRLVIIESFFCVNRSYLLNSMRSKILCSFIFVAVIIIIIAGTLYEVFCGVKMATGAILFQIFLLIILTNVAVATRRHKEAFDAIRRLDEKCGVDKDYAAEIKANVKIICAIVILTTVINFCGAKICLGWLSPSVKVIVCVASTTVVAEMAVIMVLIHSINVRLSKLKEVDPIYGSKVYRHVLMATTYLNKCFRNEVMIIFLMTTVTTLVYAVVLLLIDSDMVTKMLVYLIWDELKSLSFIWVLCGTAAKTESICDQLSFHLAGKLTVDAHIYKSKKSEQYKTIHRWLKSVMYERPRFAAGSAIIINLTVPLRIVDMIATYLILIIQDLLDPQLVKRIYKE